jgi:iron complex transport system substrate-binding protein
MCVVMVLGLAACGNSTKNNTTAQNSVTPGAVTQMPTGSADQEKITLTDQAGRTVTLDKPAKKIVSCYYITTYSCIALGIKDRLVGIESKAGMRNIYKLAAPELLNLPSVGSMKEFNVEAAAALKPDLVIMPKKLMKNADTLTQLGIPVLIVNPESQSLLEEMLTLISTACGVKENCDKLLTYDKDSLNQIKKITDQVPENKKPSVYMAGNSSYLSTATASMYQADLIQLAGGKNAASKIKGDYWTNVSYEDILAMNPDVIILPAATEYKIEDVLKDSQLSEVTAVKNKAVYQMPVKLEEWDSPIPSGVLGIRWLCSILHEDLYGFDEMQKDAVTFYKTFYGFDLDKTLITK